MIDGIDGARDTGALVFHAGTALQGERLVTNGGRVLSVVGTGADLAEAAAHAFAAADRIHFDGKQVRRDVAKSLVHLPA
jgi:phosphoribosylamine--glycine ligase